MLAQKNRLGHSDALRTVIRRGRMFRVPGFLLRTRATHDAETRFAVAISEKAEKRAVRRNRVRRQIYGMARREMKRIRPGLDCYITVQKSAFAQTSKERLTALFTLFRKAGIL